MRLCTHEVVQPLDLLLSPCQQQISEWPMFKSRSLKHTYLYGYVKSYSYWINIHIHILTCIHIQICSFVCVKTFWQKKVSVLLRLDTYGASSAIVFDLRKCICICNCMCVRYTYANIYNICMCVCVCEYALFSRMWI